jgi:hypothetical protein
MDKDWGDGLPLVPHTRYNVEQMLKATSYIFILSPDTAKELKERGIHSCFRFSSPQGAGNRTRKAIKTS